MGKKLILLAMAVAAVAAFAMPAAASALTLQDHSGVVGTGKVILGTSVDTETTNTPLGVLFCNHINVNATVKTNNGTEITATGNAVEVPAVCEASGNPLTVTDPTLVHLKTTGNDKGVVTLRFTADVGPFECEYEGVNREFTYNTGTNNNVLTIPGAILVSPAEFCEPEEGNPELHGTFALTTENGDPVWVS